MSYSTGCELGEKERKNKKVYTIEEALEKVYIVRSGGTSCYISLPQIMFGKKVKLTIVGDLKLKFERKTKRK